MNLSTALAEYQAREFFAHSACRSWCIRHNCSIREDALNIVIVSNISGEAYICVSSQLDADSRVDTPYVCALRALYRLNIDRAMKNDELVAELLGYYVA